MTRAGPAALVWLGLSSWLVGCDETATATTDTAAVEEDADERLDAEDDLATDIVSERRDGGATDARGDVDLDAVSPGDAGSERPDVRVPDACSFGQRTTCECYNGVAGMAACHRSGQMGACTCVRAEADGGVLALPARLVAPLSGTRVSSSRPTLRWRLPAGVSRARVRLCDDRPCARVLGSVEIRGESWRSEVALRAGVTFWNVEGLDDEGATVWRSATWSFKARARDTGTDTAVVPLHDFDGDGYDDVVAQAGAFIGPKTLIMFPGSPAGLRADAAVALSTPEPGVRGSDNLFGHTATVGDLNGDGMADLVVGEPFFESISSARSRTYGHVHVYWGGEGGLDASRTQVVSVESTFVREAVDYSFGMGTGAVDFNGDGYDDLLVLRPGSVYEHELPQMFLFYGGPGGVDLSSRQGATAAYELYFWSDARGIGDVDGDGYGDFALGLRQPENLHGLAVLHGNPSGVIDLRVEEIVYRRPGDFAYPVYGGDFNGDGLSDVMGGAYANIRVLYGSPEGLEPGSSPNSAPFPISLFGMLRFGDSLSLPGDINGDGISDISASAACDSAYIEPGFPCFIGVVFLHRGTTSGVEAVSSRRLVARRLDDPAWDVYATAGPGDVDGDGVDDLIVGAPGAVRAVVVMEGATRGALHVYRGGAWTWSAPTARVWADDPGWTELGKALY